MPYADAEKRRESGNERSRRHRAKLRDAKYGPNAPDQRGRHTNHVRGEAHPRWNHGRMLTSHGYVAVRVHEGHPHRWGIGYAYEHILVAEAASGRSLTDGEIVHHRNGDKTDNRPENLEILTVEEHMRHHAVERGRDALGRFPPEDLRVREMPGAARA